MVSFMPQPPYPTHHWAGGSLYPSGRLYAEAETEACAFRWESNLGPLVTQPVPQARFTYHTD